MIAGLVLIAAGLYYVATVAIAAARKHDDRVVSGEPRRIRRGEQTRR